MWNGEENEGNVILPENSIVAMLSNIQRDDLDQAFADFEDLFNRVLAAEAGIYNFNVSKAWLVCKFAESALRYRKPEALHTIRESEYWQYTVHAERPALDLLLEEFVGCLHDEDPDLEKLNHARNNMSDNLKLCLDLAADRLLANHVCDSLILEVDDLSGIYEFADAVRYRDFWQEIIDRYAVPIIGIAVNLPEVRDFERHQQPADEDNRFAEEMFEPDQRVADEDDGLVQDMVDCIIDNSYDGAYEILGRLVNAGVAPEDQARYVCIALTTMIAHTKVDMLTAFIPSALFQNSLDHMGEQLRDSVAHFFMLALYELNIEEDMDVEPGFMSPQLATCVLIASIPQFSGAIRHKMIEEAPDLDVVAPDGVNPQDMHEYWQRFMNRFIAPNIQVAHDGANGNIVLPPLQLAA